MRESTHRASFETTIVAEAVSARISSPSQTGHEPPEFDGFAFLVDRVMAEALKEEDLRLVCYERLVPPSDSSLYHLVRSRNLTES